MGLPNLVSSILQFTIKKIHNHKSMPVQVRHPGLSRSGLSIFSAPFLFAYEMGLLIVAKILILILRMGFLWIWSRARALGSLGFDKGMKKDDINISP